MITKTNPEVGKYVISQPWILHGFCGPEWGPITKISGSRIYFINLKNDDRPEIWLNKFVALCDTKDEAEALIYFSRECGREVMELKDRHAKRFAEFFSK